MNSKITAMVDELRGKLEISECAAAAAVAEGDRIMSDWQEQIRKTCAALKQRNDAEKERDDLREDAELGECIREKFRLMKVSTAVRFLGCLGVNEPEGGFDWSKTVLELIDAAIAQGKGE